MAKNDWIVASLNNPQFAPEDMEDVLGLSIDNTQLLSKDEYERSPYIQNHEAFKNEDGSFSRLKFEQFYNDKLENWNKFTSNEQLDSFEYSLFHTRAQADSKVKNPNFRFETVLNADRITTGIAGWSQEQGKRILTPSEIAQTQQIFDPETGKYLDETPNDRALANNPLKWIKNLFEEPLVLATYDKDTEEFDPFSGQMVTHKKGEYKLNSDGTYYTEKLNGRSLAGKQVVSNTDLLTIDGSTLNKYDFFDSDSLDKSVVSTILKTAATVTPLFLGGPVSQIYSGLLIARELSKTLPMLYGMTTSLFGNESEPEFLNTLAGYGEKFTGGVSEYGSQHTFSFEQFGKLLGDVATQWGQQRLIANTVSKLRNSNGIMERAYANAKIEHDTQLAKALNAAKSGQMPEQEAMRILDIVKKGGGDWTNDSFGKAALAKFMPAAEALVHRNSRLGADAALAYMALVSNYDVYNTMLERGATHKDASIVSLMSTVGMYGVDKYLHLGEMFFDDLEDQAQKHIREYARQEAANYADALQLGIGRQLPEKIEGNIVKRIGINAKSKNAEIGEATLIRKGLNLGKAIGEEAVNTMKNYTEGVAHHSLSATGKAIGEGLEEATEEFVSDISKQLYEWAGQLGVNTSIEDAGAWENWFDRYAMSFLGGAMGGAVFYGVGQVESAKQKSKNPNSNNAEDEMIYLLRQHRKGDIMKELDKLHKDGKLGSTKLGIKFEKSGNENVYLKAENGNITQNDAIYNFISQQINILDGYLNEYGANLSDDELFKQMVLADDRLMSIKEQLNGASYSTGYRQNFQSILSDLTKAKEALKDSEDNLTDLEQRRKQAEQQKEDTKSLLEQIAEVNKVKPTLESNLREAEKKLDEFLTGKLSIDYARKMTWLADPVMANIWTYGTFDQWLAKKYNTTFDNLSQVEKEKYQTEYLNDLNYKREFDSDQAWESFKQVEKDFTSYLTSLEQNPQEILKIKDSFQTLSDLRDKINNLITKGILTIQDRVPGETDEDFSDQEKHAENVRTYNAEKFKDLQFIQQRVADVVNLLKTPGIILDPQTYRLARNFFRNINRTYAFNQAIVSSIADANQIGDNQVEVSYNDTMGQINLDFIKDTVTDILTATKQQRESEGHMKLDLLRFLRTMQAALETNPVSVLSNDQIFDPKVPFNLLEDPNAYDENDDVKQEYIDDIISNPDKILKLRTDFNTKLDTWINENIQDMFSADLSANLESELIQQHIDTVQSLNTLDDLQAYLNTLVLQGTDTDINDLILTLLNSVEGIWKSLLEVQTQNEVDNILNSINSTLKSDLNLKSSLKIGSIDSTKYTDNLRNTLEQGIKDNPMMQFLELGNKVLQQANPLAEISKISASKFGINEVELETVLDKIESRFDQTGNLEDFVMTPQEEQTLDYLSHILKLMDGFLYQGAITPTWLNSFGHAKFWNDFAKKHSDVVGQGFHLPEIDADVSNLFRRELSTIQALIDEWKNIHETNAVNKERQFNLAAEKLESVKLQFYKTINSKLRGILINGASSDLLDDIKDSDTSLDIETKIANNLYDLLTKQNITFREFLEKTRLLEDILPNALDSIQDQITSDLDDKFKYGDDFTAYQRMQMLLGMLLQNSSKFESANKKKLTADSKIAPISIQKYIVQVGKGFINSANIIQQVYDYLESKNKLPKDVAILNRCMIIPGVGGAGKTSAVVSQIVEDVEDSTIWTAAALDTQLQTLNHAVNKNPAKTFDRSQLMHEILEDYSAYESSIQNNVLKGNGDNNFRKTGKNTYLDTGNLKVKHTQNAPKVLVIDEATHYSNYEIQLINRWANENNVQVILSGDPHQMGAKEGQGFRNSFTLFRMPKLKTSLRDSNNRVQNNNANIDKVVSKLESEQSKYDKTQKGEDALEDIAKQEYSTLELEYYLDDDKLNGTMVTKTLSDQLLSVLAASNSVAFVGNVDSEIMKQLKDAGLQFVPKKNLFNSVSDIQSKEFDYVICDTNLELNDDDFVGSYFGDIVLEQAKLLYTLNTRAKNGLVIIDNDFSQVYDCKNTRYPTTATAKTIAAAVQSFVNKELERFSSLDLSGEYHDLSEINDNQFENSTTETKPANIETIEDLDNLQKEAEEKVTKELEKQDSDTYEVEEKLSNLDSESNIDQVEDPSFSMNVIGYSMPILGGYKRIEQDDGTNKYERISPEVINGKTILKDLAAITILDKSIKSDLSIEQLKSESSPIAKYFEFVSQIGNILIGKPASGGIIEEFISVNQLKTILSGESDKLLADGRKEGVYLEVVDKGDGDQFFGLTDSDEDLMEINGKVYKYVLRFTPPNSRNFKNQDQEVAITLGLAANPETWKKKLSKFDLSDPKQVAERDKLAANIQNYENYLQRIKDSQKSKRVKLTGAFSKLRGFKYKKRLGTLKIGGKSPKYEQGWLDQAGKYKVHSNIYILGNDVDEFGIKACNSGKAVMFVSNFNYKAEELYKIYQNEKNNPNSPCTVRMIILDNAGVNWSSLTNSNYEELYHQSKDVTTPFKADVMGFRLLTAMWNWRADLTNFLEAYKQQFTDKGYDDDKVIRIVNAYDSINSPENPNVEDILTKYGISEDELNLVEDFNKFCTDNNIHTFRIGGNTKNSKHIQTIPDVDLEKYFGGQNIPQNVKDYGVKCLYIAPQLAKEYLAYINATFKVFDPNGDGILSIDIYRNGIKTPYSVKDRINGDRLGTLSHNKESNSTQQENNVQAQTSDEEGGSLTSLIKDVTKGIEVTDSDGNIYTIKYGGDKSELGTFAKNLIHLFSRVKQDVYHLSGGNRFNKGHIVIKSEGVDGEEKSITLDYSELQNLIDDSYTRNFPQSGKNAFRDPFSESIDFEYGDMFDLMLHGSLEDVASTGMNRENTNKISGAYFPQGLFVDPRSKGKGTAVLETKGGDAVALLSTDIDPRLLLIDAESDLVFNIELPSLAEESTKQKNYYTFKNNQIQLDLSQGTVKLPLTQNSKLPNDPRTLSEIIPGLEMLQINDLFTGSATINGINYKVTIYADRIQFDEDKEPNKQDNVIKSVYHFDENESFDDIKLGDINEDNYPELINFIKTQLDKSNVSTNGEITIPKNSDEIFIDNEKVGFIRENNGSLEIVLNPDKAKGTYSSNEDGNIPHIPDNIDDKELSKLLLPKSNVTREEDLKHLESHAEEFSIKGKYLERLKEILNNPEELDAFEIGLIPNDEYAQAISDLLNKLEQC